MTAHDFTETSFRLGRDRRTPTVSWTREWRRLARVSLGGAVIFRYTHPYDLDVGHGCCIRCTKYAVVVMYVASSTLISVKKIFDASPCVWRRREWSKTISGIATASLMPQLTTPHPTSKAVHDDHLCFEEPAAPSTAYVVESHGLSCFDFHEAGMCPLRFIGACRRWSSCILKHSGPSPSILPKALWWRMKSRASASTPTHVAPVLS